MSSTVTNAPNTQPPTDSNNDLLSQSLAGISKQLQDEENWIKQMKQDADEIAQDQQHLKTQIYDHHGWWIFTNTTVNTGLENQLNVEIASKTADIKSLQSQLDAAGFSALDGAINQLLSGLSQAEETCNPGVSGSVDRFKTDVKQITDLLDQIFQAMFIKLNLQKDEEESKRSGDGSGKIDIQQLMLDSVSQMTQLNTILSNIDSIADQEISSYNTDYNNASVEKNGVHWWDEWFGNGCATERKDDNIMNNATNMENLLMNIESTIAPLQNSMLTDFTQIAMEIQGIIKQLLSILNDNSLPPDQKQADLKAEAMKLFVIVIGLMGLIQQMASKDKSQSEMTMSDANSQAAQMGIVSQQASEKKLEQDREYASIMGVLMKVAEFTVGIALAAATGGAAGFLMAGMTVLDASLDLTTKLANACGGGAKGAVFSALIEMGVTAGVGSAMEAGAKAAMEASVESVMTSVNEMLTTTCKELIESGVKEAAEKAGQLSDQALAAGVQTATQTAEEAGKIAAEKTFVTILKENGLSLILRALKEGTWNGQGIHALEAMAKPAMEQAAKEAAESSIKASTDLMMTLGKVTDFTGAEAAQFSEKAEEVANEAVANVKNLTPEQVAKMSTNKSVVTAFGAGAGVGFLYGTGRSNWMGKVAEAAGDDNQTLQLILGILNQIMIMVSTLLSGNFDYSMGNIVNALTKAGRGIGYLGQGAEIYGSEQMYETDKKQGETTKEIGKIETGLDILNNLIQPSINSRQKREAEQDNKDASMTFESAFVLAENIWKYESTAARVLQA